MSFALARTNSTIVRQQPDENIDINKQIYFDYTDLSVLQQMHNISPASIPITKTDYNVKKHIVMAHGGMVCHNVDNYERIKVPNNVVVMLMGKVGHVTLGTGMEELLGICTEKLVPRYIYPPGSMVPNLNFSSEYNNEGISGVFECEEYNTSLLFQDLLLPLPDVILGYYSRYSLRNLEAQRLLTSALRYADNDGNIRGNVTVTGLSTIFERITRTLQTGEYSFLYIFACLNNNKAMTLTQNQLSTMTGAQLTKNVIFYGNTLYRTPKRVETFVGHIKIHNGDIKIRLTGDNALSLARDANHQQYRDFLVETIKDADISKLIEMIYGRGYLEVYYNENFRPFLELAHKLHENYMNDISYDNKYILIIKFLTTHMSIIQAIEKDDVEYLKKLTTSISALKNGVNPQAYNSVTNKAYNDLRYSAILTVSNPLPAAATNMQHIMDNTNTLNTMVEGAMYDIKGVEGLKYDIWDYYVKNPSLYTDILFLNVQTRIRSHHYSLIANKDVLQQISYVLIFMKLLFTIIDNEIDVIPKLSLLLENTTHIYPGIFNIDNLQNYINGFLLNNTSDGVTVMENIIYLFSDINAIYSSIPNNDINVIETTDSDKISQLIQNQNTNYVSVQTALNDDMDLAGGKGTEENFLSGLFKFFGF